MGDTSIEWTDKVWNPVSGCTKVSQGCKNCYAERVANRWWGDRKFTDVQIHPERLNQPLKWRKPSRIFVNSMSDLFHEDVPASFIDQVFATMSIAYTHTFQILTKRPERMKQYIMADSGSRVDFIVRQALGKKAGCITFPSSNIWLGFSCEDQQTAEQRIPLLLQTPSAVRFISAEPLLAPLDIKYYLYPNSKAMSPSILIPKLDWVICGGESGLGARPMHPDWAKSLRDQCQAAQVPYFFKQWGEYFPRPGGCDWAEKNRYWFFYPAPHGTSVYRIGKKRAGRVLDGRTWDQFP